MANIAFIGLGVMGGPMAGHLAQAGHDLTVYNRSIGKAKVWAEAYGGAVAITPAKAAEGADIVISCVGNDDDLSQVTLGREGAFRSMKEGSLFIDHTTVSARIARQLFVEGESRGIHAVDAPVSGGQAGAENGRLSIMCGGSEAAVAAARIVMQSYAARIVHVGGAGRGPDDQDGEPDLHRRCSSGPVRSASLRAGGGPRSRQGVRSNFGRCRAKLADGKSVEDDGAGQFRFRALRSTGCARIWALRWKKRAANGATLPVTAMVDQFYADVQAMGGHRQDTSALVRRITRA